MESRPALGLCGAVWVVDCRLVCLWGMMNLGRPGKRPKPITSIRQHSLPGILDVDTAVDTSLRICIVR